MWEKKREEAAIISIITNIRKTDIVGNGCVFVYGRN